MPGTRLAPSSLAIVENEVKMNDKARCPVHLNKYRHPIGAMATLFNRDYNSFVKDMDPRISWDVQTKEAR